MQKRVTIITPYLPPIENNMPKLPGDANTGGGETAIWQTALGLGRDGVQVQLLSLYVPGIEQTKLVIGNIEVHYLHSFKKFSPDIAFAPQLLNHIRQFSPELIMVSQLPTIMTLYAWLISRVFGVSVDVLHHGLVPSRSKRMFLLGKLNGFLVDRLIVQNESLEVYFRRFVAAQKIGIIPLGIDTKTFFPDSIVRYEPNYILFVGRLLPSKGVDVLLRALHRVKEITGSDLSLRVIGSGKELEFLQRLSRELRVKVTFYGYLGENELVQQYQGALATVLPSVYYAHTGEYNPEPEAFGLVLAESLACGTPVVASRVGGIPDWLDETTAILVQPSDVSELATALIKISFDNELRSTLAANGLDLITRKHSLYNYCKKLLEL